MKLSITYGAIHQRVRNRWGKPTRCELCDDIKPRYEWSNKNHKYNFIRKEWWQLCSTCHRKYDKEKFGRPEAWNKGISVQCNDALVEWTKINAPWNKGLKKRREIRCGRCPNVFFPPKRTSKFCSKSCASKGNKNGSKKSDH